MGGFRGQVSVEYLLVATFAFMLLVPIIIIAYSQSARFSNDVAAAQVQKIGTSIADAANTVYYAGPPSKKTVRLYFPEGITAIAFRGTAIVFTMQSSSGSYEYAAYADTNMTGELQAFSGLHTISIEAGTGEVNVTG